MQRFYLVLLFFVCCLPPGLIAQDQSSLAGYGIEANFIGGKVFKHSPKFTLPIPSFSSAIDINFIYQTCGGRLWEQRRGFPVIGIGISYTNYGIDSIYGRCLSIYPNIQIPIITGKKLEWTLRAGMGLGYVSRYYTRAPSWDTINIAIGTPVNNYTLFVTDLRYRLSKNWDLQIGANFSHISNAAFREPNLGVNMYGAHIGLRYFPVTSTPVCIKRDLPKLKNRYLFQARLGIGFNGFQTTGGPLFPAYLASAYLSRRWLSKNKMFAGIDYSYHTDIYAFLRNNEIDIGNEAQHSWKSSIYIGNEFLLGRRLGFLLQLGFYTKQAALTIGAPYYEKLGFNYYLLQKEKGPIKELYLSALLKANQTVAELVEWGIGFGF